MRRLTLGVFALVLALAVAWWLAGPTPIDAPRTPPSAEANRPRQVAPAHAGAEPGTATDAAEPERAPAPLGDEPPIETAVVRAVDAETDEPLAGVTVHYASHVANLGPLPPPDPALPYDDHAAKLEQHGAPPVVTGADGRARLVGVLANSVVVGRTERLFGTAWSTSGRDEHGEIVIRLQPDWTLRYRIVDDDGAPVAAAGALASQADAAPDQRPEFGRLGRTDRDGRCSIRHAQRSQILDAPFPIELRALAPGALGPAVRVEPRSRPSDEIVLRMPACGSVLVEVQEHDGTPLDPRYFLGRNLELFPAEGRFDRFGTGWQCELGPDGRGHFPHVGLGQRLRATVGAGATRLSVEFDGPRRAGEEVRAVLRDPGRTPVLVGKLLLPDGKPLARLGFTFAWEPAQRHGSLQGITDGAGGFRLHLEESLLEGPVTASFVLGPRGQSPIWRVDLPNRHYRPGTQDLGALEVRAMALVATGRIAGRPEIDPATTWGSVWVDDGSPRALSPSRVSFEPDGSFVVEAVCEPDAALLLRIQGSGFLTERRFPFRVGDRDLSVPVTAVLSPTIRLHVDDAHTAQGITCSLQPVGNSERGGHEVRVWDHGDELRPVGTIREVLAGTWRVRVEHAMTGSELAVSPPVELLADGAPDQRLAEVDLRGKVRTIRIRAVDAAGRPVLDRGIVCLTPAPHRLVPMPFVDGAVPLVLTAPCSLWVLVPGHRFELLEDVFEDRTVALAQAHELALRIACETPWPADLRAEIRLLPPTGVPSQLGRMLHGDGLAPFRPLGADQTVRVEVFLPGPNLVEMNLKRDPHQTGWFTSPLDLGTGELPSRATLTIDAARFRSILENVR